MKKLSSFQVTATGLMATLVFISTFFKIPIPIGTSTSMVHLGNALCIMSGLLLGPLMGGLSCAIGSLLFDILNPVYITSAPFTFIFKFIMGFTCGIIAYSHKKNASSPLLNSIAGAVSLLIYISLRLTKGVILYYYILRINLNTCLILLAKSAIVSLINACIALVIAIPLSFFLKKALCKNGVTLYSKS